MLVTQSDCIIIENTIAAKYKQRFFEQKRVVIFGCTIFARDIRNALRRRGIEIFALLDNNPEKVGKKCLNVDVWQPEDFFSRRLLHTIIIVCSKYNHEMIQQLLRLGHQEKDILDIPVSESSQRFDDSEEDFENKLQEVREGLGLYERIKGRYTNDFVMFLCPYPGTGDIYMACSYFQKYCMRNGINNYIFMVIGESCKRAAELFQIQNIEIVSELEKTRLLQAWEFLGSKKMQLKTLLYWGWRTKRFLYADKYPRITFYEMFLYDVFGLEKTVSRVLPIVDKNEEYAKKLFERKKLRQGRTVILSPYAGSFVSEMGKEEWVRIAKQLKERDYDICTNCIGELEKPIEGTTPIHFPYYEAVSVLEYAGGFIALRSGLCDIVSSAKCKMVIIYEAGFNAASYEYFSLQKMGLREEVIELMVGRHDIIMECLKVFGTDEHKEVL
ncbi:MAG TPA: hypothetical protein DDY31_14105 [Lachnospiraceae bacterium]|nr:hypothetical protein [Lachnospiraceae bacterium]